jgi:hypothetical protein
VYYFIYFILILSKYKFSASNASREEIMKTETNHPAPILETINTENNQTIRKSYETPILEQHGKWELAIGQFGSGVVGGP